MRQFKFRAWSKDHKRMFSNELFEQSAGGLLKIAKEFMPNTPHGEDGLYLPLKDEDLTFMQYTGLKDKNGKEAHHKDIIEFEDWKYVVEWDEKDSGFYLADFHHLNNPESEEHRIGSCISQGNIIGNIYETPELLQQPTG